MLLGVHAYHPHRFRSWGLHFLTVGSSVACSAFWLAAISFGVILILKGNGSQRFQGLASLFCSNMADWAVWFWQWDNCNFWFFLSMLAGWLAGWLAGVIHGRGIWGGLQFSCGIPHYGRVLVSIFQQLFASVGEIFILGGRLCGGFKFYEVLRNFSDLS